jgi:hypothetical protein
MIGIADRGVQLGQFSLVLHHQIMKPPSNPSAI